MQIIAAQKVWVLWYYTNQKCKALYSPRAGDPALYSPLLQRRQFSTHKYTVHIAVTMSIQSILCPAVYSK